MLALDRVRTPEQRSQYPVHPDVFWQQGNTMKGLKKAWQSACATARGGDQNKYPKIDRPRRSSHRTEHEFGTDGREDFHHTVRKAMLDSILQCCEQRGLTIGRVDEQPLVYLLELHYAIQPEEEEGSETDRVHMHWVYTSAGLGALQSTDSIATSVQAGA